MKILAIRLENLASLAGLHELDFTTAPLADQGLFAITGPTGAGKSTLLDALCLALYGNTPRLRQAPTRDSQVADVGGDALTTADARTLLRRGSASGFAEVDFIGRDGASYRARWAVRRARGKVDGSLQKIEQSLIELDGGRLLTAQKREFDRLLPERLGLNFEQFTRAVLLAQSEFAAFLKADDNARSELLERLTDTQHYSAISKAAYARVRDAKAALDALDARLADALPVDAETRAEFERHAETEEQALAELQADLTRRRAEGVELERDAQLSTAWQQAEAAWQQAEQAWQQSQGERERLARLDDIAPWRERAERRQTLERTLIAYRQTRESERRQLDDCEQERETLEPRLAAARQAREQAQQTYQQDQPRLDDARRLAADLDHQDQQLEQQRHEHRQVIDAATADAERHRQLIATRQPLQDRLERQRATLAELLKPREHENPEGESPDDASTDSAPTAHARRTSLNAERDRTQRDLQALQHLQQDWREGERLRQELTATQRQLELDRKRLQQLETEGRNAKTGLDAAQAEESSVRRQIEGARAARSDSVERLREHLQEDEPCPVCGGIEHPYRQAPPASPGADLLEAIERQEHEQLADQQARLEAANQRYHQCSADYRACRQGLQERERHLAALSHQRDLAEQAIDAHAGTNANANVATLRDSEDADDWFASRQQRLTRQWREAGEQLSALDDAEHALQPLEAQWQAQSLELGKLEERQSLGRERQQALEATLPTREAQRTETARQLAAQLGPHASVAEWQTRLESQRQRAETDLEAHQTRWQTLAQTHARLTQRLADIDQRQQEAQAEFAELDSAWQAWRAERPALDDERLAELLATGESDHRGLRETLNRRDRERDAASVKREERQQALRAQRRSLLPAASEDALLDEESTRELSARLTTQRETTQALERQRDERQGTRDAAQHRLREDDRRREAQQEGAREREAAEAEVTRWRRIGDLIGSADGKPFRRIAQAYNLDHLLTHANQHLRSLTPRYRLLRGGSALGILVVDGDMADEQRSVHSLSGGETFLVSLALALGLASMASHQLKIESLFIDEGFGSLDPQSLALAMDALDGLQAQGRRVGVISHVQEMHERIPLQIRVEPRGNGASGVVIESQGKR